MTSDNDDQKSLDADLRQILEGMSWMLPRIWALPEINEEAIATKFGMIGSAENVGVAVLTALGASVSADAKKTAHHLATEELKALIDFLGRRCFEIAPNRTGITH